MAEDMVMEGQFAYGYWQAYGTGNNNGAHEGWQAGVEQLREYLVGWWGFHTTPGRRGKDVFVEKILPLVEQLMRLAMDLNQSRAQTDRLWRVARGNSKRAEKKRPRNFDQWYKQLVDDGVLPDKYAS